MEFLVKSLNNIDMNLMLIILEVHMYTFIAENKHLITIKLHALLQCNFKKNALCGMIHVLQLQ